MESALGCGIFQGTTLSGFELIKDSTWTCSLVCLCLFPISSVLSCQDAVSAWVAKKSRLNRSSCVSKKSGKPKHDSITYRAKSRGKLCQAHQGAHIFTAHHFTNVWLCDLWLNSTFVSTNSLTTSKPAFTNHPSMAPVGGVNIDTSKLWTEVTPKLDDQSIFSPQMSRLAAWSTQKYKLAQQVVKHMVRKTKSQHGLKFSALSWWSDN